MSLVPLYIFQIAELLKDRNFETYLVGGSVRNMLLGRPIKDFDLTTNALPEQIKEIFPQSIMTNAKFGTVIVIAYDEFGEMQTVEITTFRSEKDYVSGRWPSHIEFSTEILEDLKRRDFTINAMAIKLDEDSEQFFKNQNPDFDRLKILDPFDGKSDLKQKIIRAVGDPEERFLEDGLRSLRACRLASILQFTIDENTKTAIKNRLEVASLISMERARDEFIRLVTESPKPSYGLELMRELGLMKIYIPELLEGFGVEQNKYHSHNIYQHLLDTVDIAPKEIRIAALFHDIAKPRSKDGEHFYGHDKLGSEMTKTILARLKFPKKDIINIANLVRYHMFYLPETEFQSKDDEEISDLQLSELKNKRNEAFKTRWSDGAIRRLVRKVGGDENIDNLIKLRIADAVANPKSSFDPAAIQTLALRISEIREQEGLISLKDLKINGKDLISLGMKVGPEIKKTLDYLLEKVTDNIELNEKEKLLDLAKEFIKNNL